MDELAQKFSEPKEERLNKQFTYIKEHCPNSYNKINEYISEIEKMELENFLKKFSGLFLINAPLDYFTDIFIKENNLAALEFLVNHFPEKSISDLMDYFRYRDFFFLQNIDQDHKIQNKADAAKFIIENAEYPEDYFVYAIKCVDFDKLFDELKNDPNIICELKDNILIFANN